MKSKTEPVRTSSAIDVRGLSRRFGTIIGELAPATVVAVGTFPDIGPDQAAAFLVGVADDVAADMAGAPAVAPALAMCADSDREACLSGRIRLGEAHQRVEFVALLELTCAVEDVDEIGRLVAEQDRQRPPQRDEEKMAGHSPHG